MLRLILQNADRKDMYWPPALPINQTKIENIFGQKQSHLYDLFTSLNVHFFLRIHFYTDHKAQILKGKKTSLGFILV